MTCCAYSCTQWGIHTQYVLLTHADDLLCLQLHTVRSPYTGRASNPCWCLAVTTAESCKLSNPPPSLLSFSFHLPGNINYHNVFTIIYILISMCNYMAPTCIFRTTPWNHVTKQRNKRKVPHLLQIEGRRAEAQFNSFWNSALRLGEWSKSHPGRFTAGKEYR